jgi:hypothetical protein
MRKQDCMAARKCAGGFLQSEKIVKNRKIIR